jgi:AcrR family transcriptional regulator
MPRPRWATLEPERRTAILDVAAAEFAAHGFTDASYNRIIQRAGISKGAMYYYFDDQEDLFVERPPTEHV